LRDEAALCTRRRAPLGHRRAVIAAIIDAAEARGYAEMRLDSLPSMTAAIALYRHFGFSEIPAYCFNPVPSTLYLARRLGRESQAR
jgi:ribosomal protein S18 acetylase RimI-like enzyme